MMKDNRFSEKCHLRTTKSSATLVISLPDCGYSFFPVFIRFHTAIKKRSHSSAFGCPLGKSLEFLRNFENFEVPSLRLELQNHEIFSKIQVISSGGTQKRYYGNVF